MIKLLYIGNFLSPKGYTPTMIEILGPRLEILGYNIKYSGRNKNQYLRFVEIIYALLTSKYDKVLISTFSTKAFYFACVASIIAKFKKKPHYLILHGGNLKNRLNNKYISDFVFGGTSINIAVSGYLESVFYNAGYKVIRIPNFLDIGNYKYNSLENSLKIPSILWVRSFDAIYNPILALDILDLVRQNYPNSNLCMVGPDKDGSMVHFKKEIYKRGLNNAVRVMGKLSKKEWHDLSKEYNIFLNTTHVDNAPVSVTEAMALGLPVVSTKVGGIPWMIEHENTGLLYPDGDSISAANAIIRLINEPDLYQRIALAARKQAEMLDWEIVKKQWQNLLG